MNQIELTPAQRLAAGADVPEAWASHVMGVAGSRLDTDFEDVCEGCRDLRGILSLGRVGSNNPRVREAVKKIAGTSAKACITFLIQEG
ncbi:hypothetical protein ISS86_00415 [Candidatus Microgenomates bacterium]|nr:hypothetical protein [Candidatus Microgenomates bacterium]